jgi:hypothetical protein
MGFKRGDKVIVTGVTLYGSFEGCEGVIIRDSQFHDWLVDVTFPDGSHDELGFDAHELAPQEPAPVSAAGLPAPTLDDVLRAGVAASDKVFELQAKLATAIEIANDYRDQIWVHQGTLRVLKSWLSKADGFSAEDGFTEASILEMVTRDLEASEAMDTRTMIAADGEGA